MLLVFGGTTEGRKAVEVLEEAGNSFYYSTKTGEQELTLHHGIRMDGAMDAEAMRTFCQEHAIRLIIDAAHPFASTLHATVAEVADSSQIPIIRYDRIYPPRDPDITWIDDYWQVPTDMHTLLATTGVQSIGKLKWLEDKGVKVIYRILNRESSIAQAKAQGATDDQLCFFEDSTFIDVDADAILLKESGLSGGFMEKAGVAKRKGMHIIALKRPEQPTPKTQRLTVVNGPFGLRRMVEQMLPDFFPLRTGFTTGACATAAVRAALLSLMDDEMPTEVCFSLPDGETMSIPVHVKQQGVASVVKDFSDDPDVTRGCTITAEVKLADTSDIRFLQGKGVGTVTLPGLGLPVGEPAINPIPRKMMEQTIRDLTQQGCDVTISVAGGEDIATKTFNERVGVVGGISIIGTSGIVHPLSHQAFVDSIGRELEVAAAMGKTAVGLATGKMGEDALVGRDEGLRVVLCGNLIGEALKLAHALGFQRVVLAIGIGKAVKLAEGHLDTHSHRVVMNKAFVGMIARATAGEEAAEACEHITLARELWNVMPEVFFEQIRTLCLGHCRTVFPTGELEIVWVRN